MKQSGDYDVSGVPRLMEQWRESGSTNWPALLKARCALLNSAEETVESAQARGMTADEKRSFDDCATQVREINAELATFKAARVAEHGADLVHLPF